MNSYSLLINAMISCFACATSFARRSAGGCGWLFLMTRQGVMYRCRCFFAPRGELFISKNIQVSFNFRILKSSPAPFMYLKPRIFFSDCSSCKAMRAICSVFFPMFVERLPPFLNRVLLFQRLREKYSIRKLFCQLFVHLINLEKMRQKTTL